MNINKVAVLISSYDGSKSLWAPLEKSFKKYWPDNLFKLYLATNNEKPKFDIFNVLAIGKEKSWSDNILKCLNLIEEDYIILTYDDQFFYKKIDTQLVEKYVDFAVENNWDYLRLHPSPRPDEYLNDYYGQILPNRPYRCSTVFSIIKKDTFKKLLVDTESAWEFERNASVRSNKFEHFYVSKKIVFPYLNAMVKGKWIPSVFRKLEKEGFGPNRGSIPFMSKYEFLIEILKRIRIKLFFNLIPKSLQLTIRKSIKR